ncbi:hypothetical protein PG993_005880 [Apiospora rasikravindrae]|uniref:MYND-type domain-containing protein n=1 Tax=Apiospora rasikravindrae TaxID=990691 RepID=A0ABR1TA22_9PEZI
MACPKAVSSLSPLIFCVVEPTGDQSDFFQRSVGWVLTSTRHPERLVTVSPYEVQQLLPLIKASTYVTLRLHVPRMNMNQQPLDHLTLYTVPEREVAMTTLPPETPSSLLNLFAGQLYLKSFYEYTQLCDLLGLLWEETVDDNGSIIEADGFILTPRRSEETVGDASTLVNKTRFTRSPTKFLQIVMTNVRRNNESIEKTHMGRLLSGRLLNRDDFELHQVDAVNQAGVGSLNWIMERSISPYLNYFELRHSTVNYFQQARPVYRPERKGAGVAEMANASLQVAAGNVILKLLSSNHANKRAASTQVVLSNNEPLLHKLVGLTHAAFDLDHPPHPTSSHEMSSARLGPCILCKKQNSPRCEKCNSAFYCSKACHRIDWPIHGILCESFTKFDASKRPTPEHFRVILFSPKNEMPQFTWMHCKWYNDNGYRYQSPTPHSLVGPRCRVERVELFLSPSLNRQLGAVMLSFNAYCMVDGSKPNKSVGSITAAMMSGSLCDWRGRITAYGEVASGVNQACCRDLDMNDWPHIAAFFLSYSCKPVSINTDPSLPSAQTHTGAGLKGVAISVAVLLVAIVIGLCCR